VRHPSFGVALRTVTVGPGAAALAFELPQRADVRGKIATDGVEGIAGARLLLRSSADELVVAEVKEDGSFEFATTVTPGPASLSVADGRFAFESGTRVLQVRVEETGAPLQLRAMNPAVVEGRVVDESGAAVAGARITATETGMLLDRLSRAGSALLDRDIGKLGDQLTRSAEGEPKPLLAVTAADGTFRVAGLPRGAASLRIARDGYGSKITKVSVPMSGDTTQAEPVALPRGCVVTGRVRRGGRAVAGVQVGVVVEGAAVVAVTGADGRYALRDLPPGDYRPAARYASFPTVRARSVAQVEDGGEASVDIDLPQGRTIRGIVTGTDAQPVEGALVLLRGEQGNPVMTDSSGAFELEAPNRDVALVIGQFDRTVRRTIDVPAQRDRVEVRIDAVRTGAVTARVIALPGRRPLSGVLLRTTRSGSEGPMPSRWFDLDAGMLRNPLFPAGTSKAVFWAEGYAPVVRDVVVRAGEEVDLGEIAMEPGSELRGVVRDENGAPVAGAEVFLGEEMDFFEYQSPMRTAEDGTFLVQGVSSAAANLLVRAAGYAWSSTPLRLPEDALGKELFEVALERGSTIEARVRGDNAEGLMVVLRRGARVVATAEVDENGVATFGNRSPGAYSLQRFGDDRTRAVAIVKQSGEVVRVDL
jgi:protocatechuate 3,4-dioxygenase beta subunit